MATSIEWTHQPGTSGETWNPLRAKLSGKRGWHCERISPGCENCYAERQNKAGARGGTGLAYNRQARDDVELYVDEKVLLKPLGWRKPRTVFVCSMTDLFGDWVTGAHLAAVFGVMAAARSHTFIVLTKRSAVMRLWFDSIGRAESPAWECIEAAAKMGAHRAYEAAHGLRWPLPNVWLGVSAEDQTRWNERVPDLLATPAALRWVSVEPQIGPIDARGVRTGNGSVVNPLTLRHPLPGSKLDRGLDWVVLGGESGPGARPYELEWARALRDQCRQCGVAFFMKQLGSRPVSLADKIIHRGHTGHLPDGFYRYLVDRKGGDPGEWPDDLKVREWPKPRR